MIHVTPTQLTLEEGKYKIEFPPTWESKGVIYKFWSWENGDKNPTRIVDLASDKTIKAIYRPIPLDQSTGLRLEKIEFSIKELGTKINEELKSLKIGVKELNELFTRNQEELKQILLEIANQLNKKDPQKAKEAKRWYNVIGKLSDFTELFTFLSGVNSIPDLLNTELAKRIIEFLSAH